MKRLLPIVFVIFAAGAAQAQMQAQRNFRASITGGGGDGKCTIEVDVDDVAVVEIAGDQGRLVTLSGQPAEWRRMQCNQSMPANPNDFRFRGIDGRGRVSLVQDPGQNRGVAVVRIEDTKGGREGYTFDLEWRGGSDNRGGRNNGGNDDRRFGNGNGPGYGNGNDDRRFGNGNGPGYGNGNGNGPGYGNGNGNGNGPGYGNGNGNGRGRGRGRNNYVVSCASNGRRSFCEAETRGGVTLLRQRSDAECRQGYSWGYDQRGIWVDRGCRADFEVGR